ncbi:MAG: HlyD family efflux transporter periplasmic adaptor subunit [Zoogloea sp.]|nr:HlyD family efflux transporter periplasmic adaptor subunit [Zoogloea sp.]
MKVNFKLPPESSNASNGLHVHYDAAKRPMPKWRWRLLLVSVLLIPSYFVFDYLKLYFWKTVPAVVVMRQVVLRADVDGWIVDRGKEGSKIGARQTLLSIDMRDSGNGGGRRGAASGVSEKTPLSYGDLRARLAVVTEALRLAERQLEIQQKRLAVMQKLRVQGAATEQELDNARFQHVQALADLNRARGDVAEVRSLAARSGRGLPRVDEAERSPAGVLGIEAPFDAVLVKQLASPGEWVQKGRELAILQGTDAPEVHAFLSPEYSSLAKPGRSATLKFMDGGRFRAEVIGVAGEAEQLPAERVSSLMPRTPSIVVRLRPLNPLPAQYRIHYLPLDVVFDNAWTWSGFYGRRLE